MCADCEAGSWAGIGRDGEMNQGCASVLAGIGLAAILFVIVAAVIVLSGGQIIIGLL